MKQFLLSIMIALPTLLAAQNNVVLRLNQLFGDEPAAIFTEYFDYDDQVFYLTRFEYYLCEFEITHDGGQITSLPDTYVLTSFDQEDYDLGSYDISEVEAIHFSVGVDEEANHIDPVLWPSNHPLAPQNPAMWWGWAAGRRFAAIEGYSDNNNSGEANAFFDFHIVGDDYLTPVSLLATSIEESGDVVVEVSADYLRCFLNVDLPSAGSNHGATILNGVVMENFDMNDVFYTEASVGVDENHNASFNVYPNPAKDEIAIQMVGSNAPVKVSIYNQIGMQVYSEQFSNGNLMQGLNLPLTSGSYVIQVEQSGNVMTDRLMIIK